MTYSKKVKQFINPVRNRKGLKNQEEKIEQINIYYKIKNAVDMVTAEELLKQQIQAKAQRIHIFEKKNKLFRQNKIFKEDAKKVY